MAGVWFAKDTVMKVDLAANITITTAAALDTFFGSATALEGIAKDITITKPMGKAEKIDLQGTDANDYQNACMEEKPANNGEISGTMLLPKTDLVAQFFNDAGTTINATHTRYKSGLATVRKLAFLVNLDDGTNEFNVVLTNVYVTDEDMKITAADGHYEITFTGVCLPADFAGPEYLD
mgnify:CR=1 FL=1|jgi:hypothetical protein|tara:strand:+ start:17210 stop:17746 length:537 start_codon:yes stop_codon:yes gene_type:complete